MLGWVDHGRLTFAPPGRCIMSRVERLGSFRLVLPKRSGAEPVLDGTALFSVLTVPSVAGIQRSKVPVMGMELTGKIAEAFERYPACTTQPSFQLPCRLRKHPYQIFAKQNYTCKRPQAVCRVGRQCTRYKQQ